MSVVRTLIGNVKGPQGATGATGATGAQGEAATIQVGAVTTGAYGTNASVTNSGTEQEAVFDFVIPQGAPGEKVTDASNLTLNEITASSADYPTFTVQERLKGVFGKIQKFLGDLKSNYVSKSMMSTSTDIGTAGQAVADAKAIKSLNDSLATKLQFGIGSNDDKTSYPRAELRSAGSASGGSKAMTVRYYPDANNYTDAMLCDKNGNLLPDYATKTELANSTFQHITVPSDLNSMTTLWQYTDFTFAETPSNAPYGAGTVYTLGGMSNVQVMFPYDFTQGTKFVFLRTRYANTWDAWYKVAVAAV